MSMIVHLGKRQGEADVKVAVRLAAEWRTAMPSDKPWGEADREAVRDMTRQCAQDPFFINRMARRLTELEAERERLIDAFQRAAPIELALVSRSALPASEPTPPLHSAQWLVIQAADMLAGEVSRRVDDHTLDARSGAGDALLDYACTRHGDQRPIEEVREEYARIKAKRTGRSAPSLTTAPTADG